MNFVEYCRTLLQREASKAGLDIIASKGMRMPPIEMGDDLRQKVYPEQPLDYDLYGAINKYGAPRMN